MLSNNYAIVCICTLILFSVTVLCGDFNLSAISDKDELWDALLRRKLTPNLIHSEEYSNDNGINATDNYEFDSDNDVINSSNAYSYDLNGDLLYRNGDTVDNYNVSEINQLNVKNDLSKSVLEEVKDDVTVGDNRKTEHNSNKNNKNSKISIDDKINIESSDLFLKNIDIFTSNDLQKTNVSLNTSSIIKRNSGFRRARPKPGQTSLVIVFDGTGSMTNCLEQLRNGAQQIIDKFMNDDENPIYNYIFVPFRDPDAGPATVTTDVNKLLDTLNNLKLFGGGDCPESTLSGISLALKYALPKSYVYVFTDAIAKDFGYDNDVMSQIQKKQTTLTFLLTGYCEVKDGPGYKVFEKLAAASNGQVYNLQSQDIKQVLNDVKETLDKKRITLQYFDSPTSKSSSVDLAIDKNLKEFSVSVAGHLPNITVLNPRNETYKDIKETVDLENLKIVNIQNPEPGNWSVKTEAKSGHSVRLTALSNVIFNFGFSLKIPQKIIDTSYNPLLGQDNILAISPSNKNFITNLTNVHVALFNEQDPKKPFSFSLGLKKIPSNDSNEIDGDIYVTTPFQPPRQPFKIYLNGFDENGNAMQRLISTVIQSTEEVPPEIFIENSIIEVKDAESFSLRCHVESLSPVVIHWKHRDDILVQKNSDQTSILEYNVNSADNSHSGDYICSASNSKGNVEEVATVKVHTEPLKLTIPISEYSSIENQSAVEIQCDVSPQRNFQISWLFNGQRIATANEYEIVGTNLIIRNLKRNHTGSYTCEVITNNDQKAATTHLTVLYPAKIFDPSYEEIDVIYGDPLNITCSAEGEPPVTTEWSFQSKFDDQQVIPFTENFPILYFQPKFEGTYTCRVKNDVGESARRDVKVRGLSNAPPVLEKPPTNQILVNTQDNVQLNCKCIESCNPLKRYYWRFKNSTFNEILFENLDKSPHVNFSENEDRNKFDFMLNLNNITEANVGVFTCFIENNMGSDEFSIDIQTKTAPQINDLILFNLSSETGQSTVILEGSSGYIRCEAYGSPIPVMRWTKNGTDLLDNERIFTQNNSLVLNNVKQLDAGIYSCQAINPFGVTTKNLSVLVVEPQIVNSPGKKPITAIEGAKVKLPCVLRPHIAPSLTWLLNGHELSLGDPKYIIDNSSIEFYANAMDSGIYECRAVVDDKYLLQETVLVIFTKPKLHSKSTKIIKVTSMSDVVLRCDATGYPIPNITWTFEGELISDSSNSITKSNEEILLKNLTIENAGAYVCDAFNSVGITQKIFYVVINDPPKILSDLPTNVTILNNEEISIECKALGNPYPKISWQLPSGDVLSGAQLNISAEVRTNISGNFICLAENSVGLDMKAVYVNIIEKPTFKPEESKLDEKIFQGTTLTINCPFEKFQTLKWFKNGKLMKEETKVIKFESITKNDRANYTCEVENAAGQNEFTYEVAVLYSPQIRRDDNELTSNNDLANKNVTEVDATVDNIFQIDCVVDAYPEPKVQWMHNDEIVSINKTLYISHVLTEDKGLYKCIASNEHGTDERLFNLQVLYAPIKDWENQTKDLYLEFNEEDEIKLNCSMDGYPKPNYFWSRNEESLPITTSEILTIPSASLEDSGMYLCRVQNTVGSNEIHFHVQVYIPAKIELISKDIQIQNTEPLNFSCTARGHPLPIVSWVYNNEVVSTTSRIHSTAVEDLSNRTNESELSYLLDQYGNGRSLREFSKFSKRSAYAEAEYENAFTVKLKLVYGEHVKKPKGMVECRTTNAAGNSDDYVAINVISKPEFVRKSQSENANDVESLEGLPIVLYCPAVGEPQPSLSWLKDNVEISDSSENIRLMNSKKYLNILQARHHDSGIYQCIAENLAGRNVLHFRVNVLVPPKIRSELVSDNTSKSDPTYEIRHVSEAENLVIFCPIFGNPELSFVWYQLRLDDLSGDEVERILQPENTSEKRLISIFNSTSYLCRADNSLGNSEYIFHILVNKPPKLINSTNDHQMISLHLGFSLDCAVTGEPEPTITWYKDRQHIDVNGDSGHISGNKFLSSNRQLLRIISSTTADAGEYMCDARNNLGAIQRRFSIEIFDRLHLSPWSAWSPCSTSCGTGTRIRRRSCLYQNGSLAMVDDPSCNDVKEQISSCEIVPCPINGEWSDWGPWLECSHKCLLQNSVIEPQQIRHRKCDSPAPQFGGKPCAGVDYEQKSCDIPFCPVDGEWSRWTPWTECSTTCGNGIQTRYRKCNNPTPDYGGRHCDGESSQTIACMNKPCPINGGWSDWSEWSECNKKCGRGQKYRRRECNNPKPSSDGAFCFGPALETIACKIRPCKSEKNIKDRYTPLVTYSDTDIALSGEYDEGDDDDDDDEENTKLAYSIRRPEAHVSPSDVRKTPDTPQKVTVEVESYIPLSGDISQMSINLKGGIGPVTISKLHCSVGYEYNEASKGCTDINECKSRNACQENQICTNSIGSFTCRCIEGYTEIAGKCYDVNECAQNSHKCSHFCENTIGSYRCHCPSDMILKSDNQTCVEDPSVHHELQKDVPVLGPKLKNRECSEGFQWRNGRCQDINECITTEDDCGEDQSCLNTQGSYLCLPTPCPDEYKRDTFSGQCVQICANQTLEKCTEDATIAQTISYTIQSLTKLPQYDEPMMKLVNYDVNRKPLEFTKFTFAKENAMNERFELKSIAKRPGIVYLYVKKSLQREKLYKLHIIGSSFDKDVLLYVSNFIIYIYIM